MPHAYQNTRIEFHILQSFPVTCLNRDDVGAPKTAVVGGVTRARVSSQCWKRQVRLAISLIFGIAVSTVLTLVVIPTLYYMAYRHRLDRLRPASIAQ